MTTTRRTGLVVAALATLLWLLFAVALLTADPDDGANIGAGLAALLALGLSVVASLTNLASLRDARAAGTTAAERLTATERGAGVLAVLSSACLVAFLALDPYADSDVVRMTTLAVGVGAFLLSTAGFAMTARARR
ncbi:hypothetical protein [Blastococcus aurantiacus]|uniref:hypothetical protein n=1 Tax=Blastococcus aurantiacus TaxID=1550231 RepID=UPI00115FC378|nr:hypothetical protein [Blastococcus aurantiacus]